MPHQVGDLIRNKSHVLKGFKGKINIVNERLVEDK